MPRRRSESDQRLTREGWVRAAWDVLKETGPDEPSIADVARRLGVTKGSFYWHFEDRADFRRAMLAHWQEVETEVVMRAMRDVTGPPAARLRAFATFLGRQLRTHHERTIFDWARDDPDVAQLLQDEQHRRIDFVARMLRDAGWPPAKARFRATAFALLMAGWFLTRPDAAGEELVKNARRIEELFAD